MTSRVIHGPLPPTFKIGDTRDMEFSRITWLERDTLVEERFSDWPDRSKLGASSYKHIVSVVTNEHGLEIHTEF
jgi:hypothetical protein